jgi:hypothetical protein
MILIFDPFDVRTHLLILPGDIADMLLIHAFLNVDAFLLDAVGLLVLYAFLKVDAFLLKLPSNAVGLLLLRTKMFHGFILDV